MGFSPLGFVDATLPILMFCTVFGVSMDYEVFLLSRIREAYEHGESNTAGVAKGLVSTAGIITSAAAIIVVTGVFTFTGITTTDTLLRMTNAYQVSQAIHVAATLGIADLLEDGPRSADDLAEDMGTHALTVDRYKAVDGSFFDAVPGADAYLLKSIIHD